MRCNRTGLKFRLHSNSARVYIVSGPVVLETSSTYAVISWTLSRLATATVEYGTTTAYGSSTIQSFYASSHTITIPTQGQTALLPNTLYHYRISGTDEAGGTYQSGDFTFTTSAGTAEPAFLSRPSSGILTYNGVSSVLIQNLAIRPGSVTNPVNIAISISNVTGSITIRDVDIADAQGGIFIFNCTGTVLMERLRMRNIGTKTMANNDIGSGKSNHIQFSESSMSGSIRNSKFLGGRTEDMLSTWHSGGRGVGQELVFEDNQIQGLVTDTATARAWDSTNGTGIILSDGAGSPKNGYVIVRRNTFLTPGQVGIQHIDGSGLQSYENIIYGQQRVQNNNPMTTWEGTPFGTSHDNTYYWTNMDGSHPDPWNHPTGFGLVFSNNTADPGLDPNDYVITL